MTLDTLDTPPAQSVPGATDLALAPVPAWVLTADGRAFRWGNRAGLDYLDLPDVSALRRIAPEDPSMAALGRLAAAAESRSDPAAASAVWTLYPHGEPRSVTCTYWPVRWEEEACLLVMALPIAAGETDEALELRDRILEAVARSAQRLLGGRGWAREGADLLAALSAAAKVDRGYFFRFLPPEHPDAAGREWVANQEIEWCAPGIAPEIDNPDLQAIDMAEWFPRWVEHFSRGVPVVCSRHEEILPDERAILDPQGVTAILTHPVLSNGRVLGFIGFDVCNERRETPFAGWAPQLVDALSTGAHLIGAAHSLEQTQERLSHALVEARQASMAKSDFLAAMSHDLRTPLNAIIGFSELIQVRLPRLEVAETDTRQVGKIADYSGHILAAGRHLISMIDDLLDLSKIEAGRMVLDEERVDCEAALDECLGLMDAGFRARGMHVRRAAPCEEAKLTCDARSLRQMLLNLLSNAEKYVQSGGCIDLEWARIPDGGLEFRIVDNGPGMTAEQAKRATEPFNTTNAKVARRGEVKSSGLGLALVDRAMRLHGGALEIDTAPGAGLTARLRFPRDRVLAAASARPAELRETGAR
jgi:signal transduction histidine kinase